MGDEVDALEPEAEFGEQPGIPLGALDATRRQPVADGTPGPPDGRPAQETPSIAASWAA